VAFLPQQLQQLDVVGFDGRVLTVGLLLAALTSVLYSVLPAWYATGGKFAANLHGAAPSRLSQGRGRLQSAVIVGELALSVVLLAGSGLLTRSFARMNAVDPGFRPDGLLELQAALPREAFPDSTARAAFWAALVGRARSINGVSDVVPVPFGMLQSSSGWANTAIETDNPAVVPDTQHVIYSLRRVPGRYFGLLGIRVLAGHPFTPADDRGETNAVVIGAGMARKFWPNTNPVGRRLRLYAQGPWKTVEGVVSDVGLIGPSPENRDLQLYMPPDTAAEFTRAAGIMVRLRPGAGESRTLAALRTAVRSVNRNAVVLTARSERSILDDNLASPRFSTTLMDLFGAMAVLLALIGLYGVIAFVVGLRTREIGIRVALGARAGDIARGVLRDGLRLALVGLAVGIAVAVGATRLLSSLLYGVGPTDPVVFGGVALALVLVALGASFIPARRAARVDPMIALRAE
jgi:putative ABC transport system permease protein